MEFRVELQLGIAMSCGIGHRYGSDTMLLWLWCGPAATALIEPLAWKTQPPYAMGTALKAKKKDSSNT